MRHLLAMTLILLLGACNLQIGELPTPTPAVPVVEFQAPLNGTNVPEGQEIDIVLLARDHGTGVARIELLIDGEFYKETAPEISAAVPVFTAATNWLAQGPGLHLLTAIAYRQDGTASTPADITVLVTVNSEE